jgi:hypothetical protein
MVQPYGFISVVKTTPMIPQHTYQTLTVFQYGWSCMLWWFYSRGGKIFKTSRSDLKIVGARWVKQVPYWGPTNIKCHHIQFSCTSDTAPRIWALGGLRVWKRKYVTMAKLLRYFASLSWQPACTYMVVSFNRLPLLSMLILCHHFMVILRSIINAAVIPLTVLWNVSMYEI